MPIFVKISCRAFIKEEKPGAATLDMRGAARLLRAVIASEKNSLGTPANSKGSLLSSFTGRKVREKGGEEVEKKVRTTKKGIYNMHDTRENKRK